MSNAMSMTEEETTLQAELARWSMWANRGSKTWSFVYHLSFGLAAVLGVIVAIISGDKSIGGAHHDLLIAGFSGFAAVLTTIGGFGGFERKWRTNRATRAALDLLSIDLSDPKRELANIRKRLKDIIEAHEIGIMGGDRPIASNGPRGAG